MSVGVLIITHDLIGATLLQSATGMLGGCPLPAETLAVSSTCEPEKEVMKARKKVDGLDQGQGVIVLTDIYGSTPSNISNSLLEYYDNLIVVAGINLPMLVRMLNYPELTLHQLANKAVTGGRDGIFPSHPGVEE